MRILLSMLFAFVIIGCTKDDLQYQNEFDKSYKAFQQFKKDNNNSYTYKTVSSSWIGISSEYTFEIINGVVISRAFTHTIIGNTKKPETGWTEEIAKSAFKSIGYSDEAIDKLIESGNLLSILEWSENKEELGTKKDESNIWTLDEVYEKAKNEWLIRRKDAEVYFENKNNSLISSAGFVPNNCQDDCFRGIRISYIIPLSKHGHW